MLWLFRFVPRKGDFIQPLEVSQKGVSLGLGMRQTNVSREISGLRDEAMLEQRPSHFTDTKRKVTAYFLTPKGLDAAREVISKVNASAVMVEIGGEKREITAGEVVKLLRSDGAAPSAYAIARCFQGSTEVLALDEVRKRVSDIQRSPGAEQGERGRRYHLAGMIDEGNFIGRKEVLSGVRRALGERGFRIMRVLGVAGMGKSAMGREVIGGARDTFDLFHYRFRRWDNFDSLVKELLEFLGSKSGTTLLGSLVEFCANNDLLVVLDDVHRLKEEVNDLIDELLAYSHKLARLKLVLLSRERTEDEAYSFAKYGKRFNEIMLAPLELSECMELASEKVFGEPGRVDEELGKKILVATGGIPLLVELLREEDIISGKVRGKGTGIIENEITGGLEKGSANLLKTISLCTLPVEKDMGKESAERIQELESRLLLERTREGLFQVHDHIREIIKGGLGFRERRGLRKELVAYLKNVIERGTEGDYLPEPMMEDLDIYFLEYIHHNIELGKVEESLDLIMISPFDVTTGPGARVLEEFLSRMEVKLDGKHGLIELLRAEIGMDQGQGERARESIKEADRLLRGGKRGKGKTGNDHRAQVLERLEVLSRRIEETARRPGRLNEMMDRVGTTEDRHDKLFLCLRIADLLAVRKEVKETRKWLREARKGVADVPLEERGHCYFKIGAACLRNGDAREAENVAREGLAVLSADEGGMRGPLNKLLGQVFIKKGQYGKAEERFNRAKVCFRRSENLFQLADTMLWEVKSLLGQVRLLEMVMKESFLGARRVDKRSRENLDDCITRIRESLLILGGITRKTGRLSTLLGREIFYPRHISLWRQLLVLRCSLEWCGGYRDYALETSRSVMELGRRTGKTDILVEGTIIHARILIYDGKSRRAGKILRELEKKRDIPPGPAREAIKFTLGSIDKDK